MRNAIYLIKQRSITIKRFEEIEELHVLERQLDKEGAYNNLVSQIELDTKVEAITEKAMKETQTAIENSDLK
ncbi:hypothetical protein CMV37_02175 [Bacillus cereus]|nr:hypothetical protein CMV37_02175 [Bacillus cereus]